MSSRTSEDRRQVKTRPLHSGQLRAVDAILKHRYVTLRCGRRFGKSELLSVISTRAAQGELIGWFAPDYRRLKPSYSAVEQALMQVKRTSNRSDGYIETIVPCPDVPGKYGSVEFWTLGDLNAGRSRNYHTVLIDEAAFASTDMMEIWRSSIKPTLLDFRGQAIVASNTNGIDQEQFFWQVCNEERHGFGPKQGDGTFGYHATSYDNPFMPVDDLDELRRTEHPLVFRQEYLAEFVDWSGVAFFSRENLLVNGAPIEAPALCDAVFATVDTATKTGKDNDGTAVVYWARNINVPGHPLMILDWEIVQIEGALLETWLPTVFEQLEHFAKVCGARYGSQGAWIEDKSSGMVLIQQALRRGWPAQAIDGKITSLGKDERAISVSGYVYRGDVKITREAHDKVTTYKGTSRNHLLSQVGGFRVGDKDAAKRADDLLDAFVYGPAIALGNWEGF